MRRLVLFGVVALAVCGCAGDDLPRAAAPEVVTVSDDAGDGAVVIETAAVQGPERTVLDVVELDSAGYVAVYRDGDGAPGELVGVSGLLSEGRHESVVIDAGVGGGDRFVVVHREAGGDEEFDPVVDAAVSGDEGVVVVQVSASDDAVGR